MSQWKGILILLIYLRPREPLILELNGEPLKEGSSMEYMSGFGLAIFNYGFVRVMMENRSLGMVKG